MTSNPHRAKGVTPAIKSHLSLNIGSKEKSQIKNSFWRNKLNHNLFLEEAILIKCRLRKCYKCPHGDLKPKRISKKRWLASAPIRRRSAKTKFHRKNSWKQTTGTLNRTGLTNSLNACTVPMRRPNVATWSITARPTQMTCHSPASSVPRGSVSKETRSDTRRTSHALVWPQKQELKRDKFF